MVVAHAGYLAQHGWEVEIRASRVDTVFSLPEEVRVTVDEVRGKFGTLWHALTTLFDADRVVVDIIPLACLVALRNRSRLVYFAQDYDESYYHSVFARLFIRFLYFVGLTLLRVRTIAVAEHLSTLLSRRFRANVATVENGVDTDVFFPDPDSQLIKQKGAKKAVIAFSRSDSRKGFDISLNVLKRICRENPDEIFVWLVGEPCKPVGMRCDYHHFGYVGEEQLRKVFSSANVFLYPSRHEGFPLMALESMACGCPLVTSEAVRVVEAGVEALVSSIGDVDALVSDLNKILSSEDLSEGLVAAGLDFAHRNTLKRAHENFARTLLN